MSVRDFGEANIAIYTLTSAGTAYDLVLPFEADCIEWFNYTKYATNANNLSGVWFRGYPEGDALIVSRGTTDLSSVLETTNGVTTLPTAPPLGFADTHRIPTAITKASTAVVTSANHGLTNGQMVRATDFRETPVADATGFYGLNNKLWQVGNVTTNTFSLFYPNTNMTVPYNSLNEVDFVSNGVASFNLVGPTLNTENPEPVFAYTLGTAIMGAASDVIYIKATKANAYTNLGQLV